MNPYLEAYTKLLSYLTKENAPQAIKEACTTLGAALKPSKPVQDLNSTDNLNPTPPEHLYYVDNDQWDWGDYPGEKNLATIANLVQLSKSNTPFDDESLVIELDEAEHVIAAFAVNRFEPPRSLNPDDEQVILWHSDVIGIVL